MWIQTYTGIKFKLSDPQADDVDITDIAHALSNICRFTGHTRVFLSVAQHSVNVSRLVSPENALWGLLHDASETYLGDVSSPLKPMLSEYHMLEKRTMEVICHRFGLALPMPQEVKLWDTRLLLREAELFMEQPPEKWSVKGEPANIDILPLPPYDAEQTFLKRFKELTKGDKS